MFACVCKAVRITEVSEIIESGKTTVEEIGHSCGAGTDCGSCVRRLQRLIDSQQKGPSAVASQELNAREAG